MKEAIQKTVEGFLPELWAMSREMYENPEPGLEEVNSSRLLREWLAGMGFAVEENFHGLPTAFRAVYGSGKPVIGFLCEYDALPEIGHGCGHDLIGVISAGSGCRLEGDRGHPRRHPRRVRHSRRGDHLYQGAAHR